MTKIQNWKIQKEIEIGNRKSKIQIPYSKLVSFFLLQYFKTDSVVFGYDSGSAQTP